MNISESSGDTFTLLFLVLPFLYSATLHCNDVTEVIRSTRVVNYCVLRKAFTMNLT